MAAYDDAVVAVGQGAGGSSGWQVVLLSRRGTGGDVGGGRRRRRGSRRRRGVACNTAVRDRVALLDSSDFFFSDSWILFLVSFPSFHTIEVSEAGSDSD